MKNEEAVRHHGIVVSENLLILEEITNAIRANKDAIASLNWGDVGDAVHYRDKLKDIRDQLLHLGEYAQ